VQTASTVSRLVVATSVCVSNTIQTGARTFNEKTLPNPKPLTFQPATHRRFQQVHSLTSTAAKFSSTTLNKVQTLAQNAGAKLAGKDNHERGRPRDPGILNKSMIAFCTVADGIDYATKSLLTTSSQATTSVVNHRYGPEAGNVAKALTGSFRNVGLVYIDASGVSRRGVVKGVAKGMVLGRVKGGGEVMVPPAHVDGLPLGWGDGPLGGPNAGPPIRSEPPLGSPPPYSRSATYSDPVTSTGANSTYYAQSPSPASYKPSPPGNGEYRF
jgi:spartin